MEQERLERFLELFWLDLETSEMPPLTHYDQCLVRFLAIFGYHTWPLYGVPWRKKSGRILVHDPVTKLFHSNPYNRVEGIVPIREEERSTDRSSRSDQLKMARRAEYNKTRDTHLPSSSCFFFPVQRDPLSIMQIRRFREFEIYYLVSSEDSASPLLEIPRFLKEEEEEEEEEEEMDEAYIHSGRFIKIVFKGDYYCWKYLDNLSELIASIQVHFCEIPLSIFERRRRRRNGCIYILDNL